MNQKTFDALYNFVFDTENEMWKEYGTTKGDVLRLLDKIKKR